jgi:hypothetical protein
MSCLAMPNAADVSAGSVSRNSILDARPSNAMLKATFVIKRQWILSSDYQVGWTNFLGQIFSMAYAWYRPSTSIVSSVPCRPNEQ